MVAALFVETGGCYFGLPGVDPWDQARDARLYAGPYPVVAHPPCQTWINLAKVNAKRWGSPVDSDGGCFAAALATVRRFGGVLEHPATSRAFATFGIPKPNIGGWQRTSDGDWITEVWQSAYGHGARKATWLLCHGLLPPNLDWRRVDGEFQIGFFDRIKPQLPLKERAKTPPAFRDLSPIDRALGAESTSRMTIRTHRRALNRLEKVDAIFGGAIADRFTIIFDNGKDVTVSAIDLDDAERKATALMSDAKPVITMALAFGRDIRHLARREG
jgi:hypothetical protein